MVRGVGSVGFVGWPCGSTQSDAGGGSKSGAKGDQVRWVLLGLGAVVLLLCLRGTGLIHGSVVNVSATALAAVGAIGGLYGAWVGASHARHERAWEDYRTVVRQLPRVRLAWLRSLGVHTRRLALPVGVLVLALLWLKGRH